jgi:hypothetical protein
MANDLSYFTAERDDDQFEVTELLQSEEHIQPVNALPPSHFNSDKFSQTSANSIYALLLKTPYNINALDLSVTYVKVINPNYLDTHR